MESVFSTGIELHALSLFLSFYETPLPPPPPPHPPIILLEMLQFYESNNKKLAQNTTSSNNSIVYEPILSQFFCFLHPKNFRKPYIWFSEVSNV